MNLLLYAELPSWSVALGVIGVLVIGTLLLALWLSSGDPTDPIEALFVPLGLMPCVQTDGSGRTHFQGMWRGAVPMIIGRPPPAEQPLRLGDAVIDGVALAMIVMFASGNGSGRRWGEPPPPVPARVFVSGRLPAGLKVTEADALSRLGVWLGVGQDLEIGEAALDKRLIIRGADPQAVRALLTEPFVRAALVSLLAHRDRYQDLVIDEAGAALSFALHPGPDDIATLDALAALGAALERRCEPLDPLAAFGV